MKQVIIKRISMQNFISTGQAPVEMIYQNGITIVTGYNHDENSSNGVGKSTIFADALFFVLFGQPLRPMSKSMIPNRRTGGRCIVELDFEVIAGETRDQYTLIRKMRPSRLYLTKNGQDESRNINKSTQEINVIINASPDVFRNCVIMSLNNTLPFMMQSKVEKRKFIEGILRLDVFSNMLLEVRRSITDVGREVESHRTLVTERDGTLTTYVEQQQLQYKEREKQTNELKARVSDNLRKIKQLQAAVQAAPPVINVEELRGNIAKLQEQQDKSTSNIHSHVRQQAALQEKLNGLTKSINRIKDKPTNCPLCKRPFDEHNQQELTTELAQLNADRVRLNVELKEADKQLKTHQAVATNCKAVMQKLTDQIDQLHTATANSNRSQAQIDQLTQYNKDIARDIKTIENRVDQFEDIIKQSQTALDAARQQLNDVVVQLEVLETVRFVVSEEGVKSYIIKKMLKLFNSRLAYYLQKLGANCKCTFNEYFEETIIDDQGNETSYANFSGGEGKRIDLAMLFTFQDIRRLQADSAINVCIYDELFDSSLDNSGVMAAIEILRERCAKYNEAAYIISHRNDSVKLLDDISIIHLEKRNGITNIAQHETTI